MKLVDTFDLSASPDRVWQVLNDVELIAPYVPGFELNEVNGDVFRGTMKVKLGAMTVQYETEITIAARDDASRAVHMAVAGRERRGSGKMKAAVTSRLEQGGAGTAVTLETDLELTGKVAQMGRGMIADVSKKLVREFVLSLEAGIFSGAPFDADASGRYTAESAAAGAPPVERSVPLDGESFKGGSSEGGASPTPMSESEPATTRRLEAARPPESVVDVTWVAGRSAAKRIGPAIAAALMLLLLVRARRR